MAALVAAGLAWLAAPAQGAAEAAAALTIGSGAAPLFDGATPLAPGHWQAACVVVGAQDAGTGDRMTVTAEGVSGVLAAGLAVRVEVGSGGGHGSCTGFSGTPVFDGTLAALAAGEVDTGWEPATVAARTFRISVTVPDRPELAGSAATGRLVWRLPAGEPAPPPPAATPAPPSTAAGPATSPAPVPAATQPAPTGSVTGPAATTPAASRPAAPPATSAGASGPAGGGDDRPDVVVRVRGVKAAALRQVNRAVEAAVASFADPVTARRTAETVTTVLEQPQYPIAALLLGLLFLSLQGWLDRRDPKLADASLSSREEQLLFPDRFPSSFPSRFPSNGAPA